MIGLAYENKATMKKVSNLVKAAIGYAKPITIGAI
jgi:hypothetical protein